jgi:ribosomal protein S18 acetylase RimI-like enzyme
METEVPILYRISMQGFRDNYLFEPIPFEAFRQLYVPIAKKLDFSLSRFAIDPQGQEMGFFFCYMEGDSLVFKSVTIDPAYRGRGVSNALTHLSSTDALKRGATGYISALMRAGAQSESYLKKGGFLWQHKYALFEKA